MFAWWIKIFNWVTKCCQWRQSTANIRDSNPNVGQSSKIVFIKLWMNELKIGTQEPYVITSSSAMTERPRELGDLKKAPINGGTDNHSLKGFSQVSPLPLTDPLHGNQIISSTRPSCWIQISTVIREQHCGRPSDVYNTDRRSKLTALEMISRWLLLNKRKIAIWATI